MKRTLAKIGLVASMAIAGAGLVDAVSSSINYIGITPERWLTERQPYAAQENVIDLGLVAVGVAGASLSKRKLYQLNGEDALSGVSIN